MRFRQGWTTHNVTHEGGRRTHAMRDESEVTLCGLDLSCYFAAYGELREEPVEKLWLYVDCRRCLRTLERPLESAGADAAVSSPA